VEIVLTSSVYITFGLFIIKLSSPLIRHRSDFAGAQADRITKGPNNTVAAVRRREGRAAMGLSEIRECLGMLALRG
jgi:hypothetical protein